MSYQPYALQFANRGRQQLPQILNPKKGYINIARSGLCEF